MSKRRSDTQLTKDDYEAQMNGNFNFSANHTSEGGPDDVVDPSKMADSKILVGRKIAPLKRGRGRGGAAGGGSRGGGSSIPNFFATTPTGGFGANGTSQPDGGMGAFSGFGTPSAAATTPSFGGNATGGFGFGGNNNTPEQPKVNPFGSLAPASSSTTNGGGMFGSQPQLGGSLFGSPAPQNTSTGGMFGSNNNNNNGTASPAPAPGGFTFGGNSSNAAPAAGFKAPQFSFGGNNNTASPMFGGDNKPATSSSFTFGANNTGTPAVTPPATSSFTFGGSNTTATAPPATTGGYFGTPSTAPEKTPEPQSTPAVAASAPSFTFGAATPTQPATGSSLFGKPADSQGQSLFAKPAEQQGSSLFGKPVESQGSSLFGRPSPSPEPTSVNLFAPPKPTPSPEPTANGLFGSPAPTPAPTTTSFFGQPKEQEQNKPLFGFGDNKPETPKQEPPKSLFGGFGDSKPETPKQPFFGGFGTPTTEKKEEPSKPLFGFGAVTEKKQEPAKEAPKSPFSFGTPSAPIEKKDDDVMDENPSPPKSPSVFDQPINNANSFSGFGTPKAAAPSNQFTAPPIFAPTTTNSTTTNARTPSPPLPSDSTLWTTAQLNEYYNLFALRALNHSFLEGLKKADQMGDWSVACEIYIKESERIKDCQQNGERYKGASTESKPGPAVTGKRGSSSYDDNEIQGGGKRPKSNGEDSRPSGSDSSKALASIIGGSTASGANDYKLANKPTYGFVPPTSSSSSSSGPKLASAPLFGFNPPSTTVVKKEEKKSGSVFDSPNSPVNNGGFVNPFQAHTPDPSEKDQGDEDDEPAPAPVSAGSLFGRISEPKKEPTSSGSIFSNSNKSSPGGGLFSSKLDQTWSPDKGVKFETNGTNGSIFGTKSDAPKGFFVTGSSASSTATTPGVSGASSLFGTPAPKSEVGFSFGGNGTTKPSGPISIPSSSAVSTPDGDTSEPNDNAHLAKNEIDLSAQGPGEEDEDSQFQVRAIIYEVLSGVAPKKAGVGTLRVLKNRITGKARVVTRTESGKVALNVGLVKEVTYGLGDKGGKNVSIVEFLPEGGSKRYTVRVKDEADAKKLGEVMDVAKLS